MFKVSFDELKQRRQAAGSRKEFEDQKEIEEMEESLGNTDTSHARGPGAISTGSFRTDPGDYDWKNRL